MGGSGNCALPGPNKFAAAAGDQVFVGVGWLWCEHGLLSGPVADCLAFSMVIAAKGKASGSHKSAALQLGLAVAIVELSMAWTQLQIEEQLREAGLTADPAAPCLGRIAVWQG